MDAWLYLLNHAGDELLTRQAKDMVTKEELSTIVASRVLRGIAEGVAEARAKGHADVENVLRKKGLSEKLIAEIQAELKTMS